MKCGDTTVERVCLCCGGPSSSGSLCPPCAFAGCEAGAGCRCDQVRYRQFLLTEEGKAWYADRVARRLPLDAADPP